MRPASRCAAAGKRVPSWIARCIHTCFPWRFANSTCPACCDPTRPRRPMRLEVEILGPRESPTSLLFSSSLTISLLSMHPPVSSPPALVQTQSSFAPISIAGETPVHSPPSPLGGEGTGVRRNAADWGDTPTSTSASTASPWTWLTSAFIVNLQGMPPPDPSLEDPLWLDTLPSHKPGSQLSDSGPPNATPPASINDGGTGGGGSAFSSGSPSTLFGAGDAMASGGSYAPGLSVGGATSGVGSSSSAPNTPVANAAGSGIGAATLPTNILLAPTVPLTTNNSPLTNTTTDSSLITQNSSPPTPISPQGGPGGGGPPVAAGPGPEDIIPDISCG